MRTRLTSSSVRQPPRPLSSLLSKRATRYTSEHSQAVVAQAVAIGCRLSLPLEELADLAQVALLHDIGKIAVPDTILAKQGPLTDCEWDVMRLHPIHGERIVCNIPEIAHLAPAIRAEHERWDGQGYPDGLAGEAIPLASRITLVSDAFHAMTSERPYRAALDPQAARDQIAAGIGGQFCPTAATALLEILDEERG